MTLTPTMIRLRMRYSRYARQNKVSHVLAALRQLTFLKKNVEDAIAQARALAEAAKADVETGATDFETLVSDRGLSLADVDLGDVDADDLGEAGDAVFNAEPGGGGASSAVVINAVMHRASGWETRLRMTPRGVSTHRVRF